MKTASSTVVWPRPLVTETFKIAGRDVFVAASYGVLNVGYEAGMQAWDEVLDPFLDTVEYENELVRCWWPIGKGVRVVVDPDYGFGLPVIAGERRGAGDEKVSSLSLTIRACADRLATMEEVPIP